MLVGPWGIYKYAANVQSTFSSAKALHFHSTLWEIYKSKHKCFTHKGCKHLITCNQCKSLWGQTLPLVLSVHTKRAAVFSQANCEVTFHTVGKIKSPCFSRWWGGGGGGGVLLRPLLLRNSDFKTPHLKTKASLQRASRSRQNYSISIVNSHTSWLYTPPDQYNPPITAPQPCDATQILGSILTWGGRGLYLPG